jgi:hypothetical protein
LSPLPVKCELHMRRDHPAPSTLRDSIRPSMESLDVTWQCIATKLLHAVTTCQSVSLQPTTGPNNVARGIYTSENYIVETGKPSAFRHCRLVSKAKCVTFPMKRETRWARVWNTGTFFKSRALFVLNYKFIWSFVLHATSLTSRFV